MKIVIIDSLMKKYSNLVQDWKKKQAKSIDKKLSNLIGVWGEKLIIVKEKYWWKNCQ